MEPTRAVYFFKMTSSFHLLVYWILIQGLAVTILALQITKVDLPPVVLSGEPVTLSCQYSLQGESLYSLSWWKDDKLFYRYVPAVIPPQTVYDVPGIVVDKSSSDLREVVLSKVDHRASGHILCEVVSERSFENDAKGKNMTVIVRPQRAPRISGKFSGYKQGDLLALNCSSAPSHPPATLHWYINGKQASTETIIIYPAIKNKEGLIASSSGLQMFLQASHFIKGALVIGCSASILHIKSQVSEVIIMDSDNPLEAPKIQFSEGRSTGLSLKGTGHDHLLALLLLLLAWRSTT